MEPSARQDTDLDALRLRRAELRESMGALEAALAAAASGRAAPWGQRAHAAIVELAEDFDDHIAITEGPAGLHEDILAGDLRLANAVATLTVEHALIATEIAGLVTDTEPLIAPDRVDEVRDRGTKLLSQIARHRQRGADLVYEAYHTDLGGGD